MNNAIELTDERRQALAALETRGTKAEKSFAELAGGTAIIEGRTLRDKADLIGVPHIITAVTFRPTGEGKGARDFVSVEAVDIADLSIVYNDGSTGIRRQIVEYLCAQGLLHVDSPDDSVITSPEAGSLSFGFDNDGGIPTLAVPRGLRLSQYRNEFGDAETYYLA